MSSLEKCLVRSSANFLIVLGFCGGCFVCLMLSSMSSFYILDVNPLSDILNIFSHSVGSISILLIVPFAVKELFHLM